MIVYIILGIVVHFITTTCGHSESMKSKSVGKMTTKRKLLRQTSLQREENLKTNPISTLIKPTCQNEEMCKVADLCVHDKVPMCGIDSCGEMRTFIDTCDMHEFNCDSKKDFKSRPIHECWVTCKRGRSFKKPEFRSDCNINQKSMRA